MSRANEAGANVQMISVSGDFRVYDRFQPELRRAIRDFPRKLSAVEVDDFVEAECDRTGCTYRDAEARVAQMLDNMSEQMSGAA